MISFLSTFERCPNREKNNHIITLEMFQMAHLKNLFLIVLILKNSYFSINFSLIKTHKYNSLEAIHLSVLEKHILFWRMKNPLFSMSRKNLYDFYIWMGWFQLILLSLIEIFEGFHRTFVILKKGNQRAEFCFPWIQAFLKEKLYNWEFWDGSSSFYLLCQIWYSWIVRWKIFNWRH